MQHSRARKRRFELWRDSQPQVTPASRLSVTTPKQLAAEMRVEADGEFAQATAGWTSPWDGEGLRFLEGERGK